MSESTDEVPTTAVVEREEVEGEVPIDEPGTGETSAEAVVEATMDESEEEKQKEDSLKKVDDISIEKEGDLNASLKKLSVSAQQNS